MEVRSTDPDPNAGPAAPPVFPAKPSRKVEFALSSSTSAAFHVGVFLFLLYAAPALTKQTARAPRLDVLRVGNDAAVGSLGPDGSPPGDGAAALRGTPAASADETAAAVLSSLADTAPAEIQTPGAKLPDLPPGNAQMPASLVGSIGQRAPGMDHAGSAGDRTSGTGSGLGGKGAVAATRFFGARAEGRKFVYVIDRSGSMSEQDALGAAKRELLASLEALPPETQFQIIFYNLRAEMMPLGGPSRRLVFASAANKAAARRYLDTIVADNGTDHLPALKAALALDPDVIFFLTDADDFRLHDAKQATALNTTHAQIHAIEFGKGQTIAGPSALRDLASSNAGTYRYVTIDTLNRVRVQETGP